MTPAQTDVERVAVAMAFDRRSPMDESDGQTDFWAHTCERTKEDWRGTARAAIAAMQPSVAEAAKVFLADEDELTDLAVQIAQRNNQADGSKIGIRPALISALRALSKETPDA